MVLPTKKSESKRSRSLSYALEPRILFDGAAAATADATVPADNPLVAPGDGSLLDQQTDAVLHALATTDSQNATDENHGEQTQAEVGSDTPVLFTTTIEDAVVTAAINDAQQRVHDFIRQADDQTLFKLFGGQSSSLDADWSERLSSLRSAIDAGEFTLNIVEIDAASQTTSIAAYTHAGPNGEPTVFINRYWFDLFAGNDATRALVEEFGHAIDDYLNPTADTAGDEGESFAATVMADVFGNSDTSQTTQNDQGTVTVDGVSYDVEFASFSFATAYQIVVDINDSTTISGGIDSRLTGTNNTTVTNSANTANQTYEYNIDKESSNHNFIYTSTGLGQVTVNDDVNRVHSESITH